MRNEVFQRMMKVHEEEKQEKGAIVEYGNWRVAVEEPFEAGDVNGMKEASLPSLQLKMLDLAHTGRKEESVQFQATAFLLGQAGHGPMSRIEHTVDYKRLPEDQLISVIQSKLANIQQLNPKFDVQALLPGVQVEDAEFEEE